MTNLPASKVIPVIKHPTTALFGGSFNPVHWAHLNIIQAVLNINGVEKLELIPANNPWQKHNLISSHHRLAMLELALQNLSPELQTKISINQLELQRQGATYTIDTLRQLEPKSYLWVIGSDQLQNFTTWHDWSEILVKVGLAVIKRPNYSTQISAQLAQAIGEQGSYIVEVPCEAQEISSTEIRQNIINQADYSNYSKWLPENVLQYIQQHHLYQT